MKRLGLVLVVFAVAVVLYRPATGQDNHEARIASLETRVAVLEGSQAPATPPMETRTISGVVFLLGSAETVVHGTLEEGHECHGRSGTAFADADVGLTITLRDSEGTVIGVGVVTTTRSTVIEAGKACALEFTVEDVPDVAFYDVAVGNRPGVAIARSNVEMAGWVIYVSIGA